ncbi:MAG TPA: pyridoxamine 5'-phosphate oxidase [Gemmatimonadales bacterium]
MRLEDLRREYSLETLDESMVARDPVVQFRQWFAEAQAAGVVEPNAMTLATATPDGVPCARIVLLKHFGEDGFAFFTDHRSRKGQELAASPRACLLFFWGELERQVRIHGPVRQLSREVSAEYFLNRPLGSQLGAWASHQSQPLTGGRAELDGRLAEVTERFAGQSVPLPPHWGGYLVVADELEFWQGRESRLHDRIRYRRGGGGWTIDRLSP